MKAIILATGYCSDMTSLVGRYPIPLLPLIDRPFLQHVVEFLVDRGITEFHFILSHLPEKIEQTLGDGTRWGSTFRYHLARNASQPYNLLKIIERGLQTTPAGEDESILLVHADRLLHIPLAQTNPSSQTPAPLLFYWTDSSLNATEDRQKWTGWAWIPRKLLANLPENLEGNAFESYLVAMTQRKGTIAEVRKPLSIQSYNDLLDSHCRVLTREFPGLLLTGRETDPGIWLSRNARLHPTVRLIPPVYIGENCRIGMGVQLGPNAVIGNDCVLDAHCMVENSVIFPGSYVGEALELREALIDKNYLINLRVGATMSVVDDFILSSLSDNQFLQGLTQALSRGAAIVLLAITWPILLATALFLKLTRRGPVLYKKERIRLPASSHKAGQRTFYLWSFCPDDSPIVLSPYGLLSLSGSVLAEAKEKDRNKTDELILREMERSPLRDFFLRFLPALINIAKGELSFVGVQPRTKGEILNLPHDWQNLYLRTKAGIITEAYVYYGENPTKEELYSAEAFYAVTAGIQHDLKLLIHYFGCMLGSFSPNKKR